MRMEAKKKVTRLIRFVQSYLPFTNRYNFGWNEDGFHSPTLYWSRKIYLFFVGPPTTNQV